MSRYPLLLMFLLLGLSWGLSALLPTPAFSGVVFIYTGWFLLLAGVLVIAGAAGLFRVLGTTVDPTKVPDRLVTSGLYRVTRNPMYLGMLLILIGCQLVLGSLYGLLFPAAFYLFMDKVLIPKEEAVIAGVFGEAYELYKQRTRRWI